MTRTYQLASTNAATLMGGVYIDCIQSGIIRAVRWSSAARWQAAIGEILSWIGLTNINDLTTNQVYGHISNFALAGSFTAAGTGSFALCKNDYGLDYPWKLGERLYLNQVLNGTGPTDIYTILLIDVAS